MIKKKDLPINILKAIEPYVNLKGDKFEVKEPKVNLLKIIDKDLESDFHFTIQKYQKATNGPFQFFLTQKPTSTDDNGTFQAWIEISKLTEQFETWKTLLNQYESVNSFFDDPIINSFKDEFYSEFEIIDEDADVNPLNTKQILLLDSYLEKVVNKLTEFKTEQNNTDIIEIQDEINLLRDKLTTKSKKWVVNQLTYIWAKLAKQGTKFIKEFLSESSKELVKQGVKGLIEYVKETGIDLLK